MPGHPAIQTDGPVFAHRSDQRDDFRHISVLSTL